MFLFIAISYTSVCLSISVCVSVCLSVCLPLSLYIYIYIHIYIYMDRYRDVFFLVRRSCFIYVCVNCVYIEDFLKQ